jgi:hypothetical protein
MISNVTFSSVRALAVPDARIDALHVDAGMVTGAVAVTVAADNVAAHLSIAVISGSAAAVSNVVGNVTLGARAANVR